MNDQRAVSARDEHLFLFKELKKSPILAKLADYAANLGVKFLIHPQSEDMRGTKKYSWMFVDMLGIQQIIFIPFDRENNVILPDSDAHRIFCFAHELGHFELKDKDASWQRPMQCPLWKTKMTETMIDACLLKELLANLKAINILKNECQTAIANHGWQVILLNIWRQCPECLTAIKANRCPHHRKVAKALAALAKKARLAQKNIALIKNQRVK